MSSMRDSLPAIGPPIGTTASDGQPNEIGSNKSRIGEWWFEKAQEELDKTIPKAEEYGSGDLVVMAAGLRLQLDPKLSADLPDSFFMEWACANYALGKVARAISSFARGRFPKPDNWFDLGVYCRMAQFIRDNGRWI